MESILEFMYLGVATLYQERMYEFLDVAKNLQIKDISKDVKFDDGNATNEKDFSDIMKQVNDDSKSVQNTNTNKIIYTNIRTVNLKHFCPSVTPHKVTEGQVTYCYR